MIGVLVMAYGGPNNLDEVEPYLLDVRGYRPTAPEIVHEVRERYKLIGGRSPILEQTQAQAEALQAALDGNTFKTFVGMRQPEKPPEDTTGKKEKPKGHGRKAAEEYTGAYKIAVPHEDLKPGDRCPGCLKGKVYAMKVPEVAVRITGTPPLQAKLYQMQRLRCNLCGEILKATPPEGIGDEKYDAASGAMIALLKYGSGMPFNRLEQLQAGLGVPLAASTQWEIVDQVADRIFPVYPVLNCQAAQGDVVYNDEKSQVLSK